MQQAPAPQQSLLDEYPAEQEAPPPPVEKSPRKPVVEKFASQTEAPTSQFAQMDLGAEPVSAPTALDEGAWGYEAQDTAAPEAHASEPAFADEHAQPYETQIDAHEPYGAQPFEQPAAEEQTPFGAEAPVEQPAFGQSFEQPAFEQPQFEQPTSEQPFDQPAVEQPLSLIHI